MSSLVQRPGIANAQTKMKAMVVARLMMGDFSDWLTFEKERKFASQVTNRRAARSVSAQIDRDYSSITQEVKKFINQNFHNCEFQSLSDLCDQIEFGNGLSMRLDEFENKHFLLKDSVKYRIPFYAHIHISPFGLRFEYPEHHFLRDMEISLPRLIETKLIQRKHKTISTNLRSNETEIGESITLENFLSRSIISETFSLVEAYLSGQFFSASERGRIGNRPCDQSFLDYATKKESAPFKDRLNRIVLFLTFDGSSGRDEPFRSLVDFGKRYRDAIHHTTRFQRNDVQPGGRLTALYQINADVAITCIGLACRTLLAIDSWSNPAADQNDWPAAGLMDVEISLFEPSVRTPLG